MCQSEWRTAQAYCAERPGQIEGQYAAMQCSYAAFLRQHLDIDGWLVCCHVHTCSAGRPKASQPMGCMTLKPCILLYLAMMSVAVYPSVHEHTSSSRPRDRSTGHNDTPRGPEAHCLLPGCPTCSPAPEGYGNLDSQCSQLTRCSCTVSLATK